MEGEYLAYVRAQVDEPEWSGVMRGVGLSVSKDFENWARKKTVLTTDEVDGYPWTQPYGSSVTPSPTLALPPWGHANKGLWTPLVPRRPLSLLRVLYLGLLFIVQHLPDFTQEVAALGRLLNECQAFVEDEVGVDGVHAVAAAKQDAHFGAPLPDLL